jgi:hypothetical protein
MEPERLDKKLLIQKCPRSFALTKTRPPFLSCATRLANPGLPGSARLAGANAQPAYGKCCSPFAISVLTSSQRSSVADAADTRGQLCNHCVLAAIVIDCSATGRKLFA